MVRIVLKKIKAFFLQKKKILWASGIVVLCIALFGAIIILYMQILQLNVEDTKSQNTITQLNSEIYDNQTIIEDIEATLSEVKDLLDIQQVTLSSQNKKLDDLQQVLEINEIIENGEIQVYKDTDLFEKIVYLTFDDGPSYNTEEILDILDTHHVKATFFVCYNTFSHENRLYKKIVERGHAIGNHTYDHVYATNNWTEFYGSLMKMEHYIYDKTGIRTKLIRFPGGTNDSWEKITKNKRNVQDLIDMGYIYFDWNVINSDADSDTPVMNSQETADYVIAHSWNRDQIILLMHDRNKKIATVNSLDAIITHYKEQGYVFLPISENSYNVQFYTPQSTSTP